jgi:putative transposase
VRVLIAQTAGLEVVTPNKLSSEGATYSMPQSLTNILIHIIFCTKNRVPLIDDEIEPELLKYITTVIQNTGSHLIKLGGTPDHIHILCALSKTIAISDLIENIKTSSSNWMKSKGTKYTDFFWQKGYGAFSIGQSGVPQLISYIENQKEHHKKVSFQEELRMLLDKYQVKFDERYIWS